ncbi:MAG: putative metal-binding motif-containing protein [Bradymonadales bacterium]|nr:putative metal-binding motif-containing protein [Bradymonadales bacterium]
MGSPRRRKGDCRRFLPAIPAAVLCLLAWFGCLNCTVGFDVTDENNLFSCQTDNECVDGYHCLFPEGSSLGVCRKYGVENPPNCVDRDGDGYLGGEGCDLPAELFDCNDDPLQNGSRVHPGRQETCDGVDEDCDNQTDEDIEPRLCDYQAGVCAGVMTTCVEGEWLDCIEAGLYGSDFQLVPQDEERCDGLDNNCSGGYPPGAGPEVIDDHCDCLPGVTPPTSCGLDIGICERGIKFCNEEGGFSPCVWAEMGDDCDDDEDCDLGGYCVSETIDYREDLLDDCVHGLPTEPGCSRKVCRYLVGSTACESTANCGSGQVCLEDYCQDQTAVNQTEVCNGLDDNCNARIDDGGVCQHCPHNMAYFPSMPASPTGLCVDLYEASRPDATATSEGVVELYAASREDVLPWSGVTNTALADDYCHGLSTQGGQLINDLINGAVPIKRLCTRAELQAACLDVYPYGASYSAGVCNESGTVLPTGSSEGCVNSQGIYDLAGNVAELYSSPVAGVFGGSAAEEGGSEVSCSAGVPLVDVEISDDFIGFRCCTLPSN